MTKSLLLATSLAAIFVASMIMVPAFAGGHLTIEEAEVEKEKGKWEVEIETSADIPTDGSAGAFGYGVIGKKAILVATTHGGVGPDHPDQGGQGDPVMHTHVVTLGPNAGCPDNLAVASITSPSFSIEIDDDELEIEGIPTSAAGKLSQTTASFNLSVLGPANAPTAVCVDDLQIFS
jgi:hypothetical protein